ncbi:unnamed protein product [Sphagnum jensenii]|uniref:Uncharacterized protein n=1 Tax=Sphagnum jensenii TaxID=128206 RepID=A0ABP0VIM6_9BRYO
MMYLILRSMLMPSPDGIASTSAKDTLAEHVVEIPDARYTDGAWHSFSDTIHYRLAGLPDTLHLIFFGGRNADSVKAGNTTWLDDISFYYTVRVRHRV